MHSQRDGFDQWLWQVKKRNGVLKIEFEFGTTLYFTEMNSFNISANSVGENGVPYVLRFKVSVSSN